MQDWLSHPALILKDRVLYFSHNQERLYNNGQAPDAGILSCRSRSLLSVNILISLVMIAREGGLPGRHSMSYEGCGEERLNRRLQKKPRVLFSALHCSRNTVTIQGCKRHPRFSQISGFPLSTLIIWMYIPESCTKSI